MFSTGLLNRTLRPHATTNLNVINAVGNQTRQLLSQIVPIRSYHKNIVEHFEKPRNVGFLDSKDNDVGTGLVGAPACGDVMKLQIKVDNSGRISDAKFNTFGCGSAIASASAATEWVKGKTLEEASALKNTEIAKYLKLPPIKLHCSMLAEDAVKMAIKNWKEKQLKDN